MSQTARNKAGKTSNMDLTRWKSILVPREMYLEVKEMASQQGRTISGQLRVMHDSYKTKTKWRSSRAEESAAEGM